MTLSGLYILGVSLSKRRICIKKVAKVAFTLDFTPLFQNYRITCLVYTVVVRIIELMGAKIIGTPRNS